MVKKMENNTSNKFIKRIKSITGEGIAVLIVSLIMLIIDIIFIVNLINGINSKQYMFNAKNQNNDIIMLVVFSILLVALLSIIIYNLFFRKFDKLRPVTKDIEHGKIVERKTGREETLKDAIKKEGKNTNSKNNNISINKEKLKENLKIENNDKPNE